MQTPSRLFLILLLCAPIGPRLALAIELDLRGDPDAGPGHTIVLAATQGIPGHAFVQFTPDNAWSFNPSRNNDPRSLFFVVDGELRQEPSTTVDAAKPQHRLAVQVDDATYARIESIRKDWLANKDEYNLTGEDCISFMQAIAREIGVTLPDRGWKFPATYMEDLIEASKELQPASPNAGHPTQDEDGHDAGIEKTCAERSQLLDKLSRTPAFPPAPERAGLLEQVRALDRRLAQMRAGRANQTPRGEPEGSREHGTTDKPGTSVGGGASNNGTDADRSDADEPFDPHGRFEALATTSLETLTRGMMKESFARADEALAALIDTLGYDLSVQEELLERARRGLLEVVGDSEIAEASRKGLRDNIKSASARILELQDELVGATGRREMFSQGLDIATSNWIGAIAGSVSLKQAENRGRALIEQGEYEEAWRTYIGGATRFVSDTVLTYVTRNVPARWAGSAAVLEAAVGAASEQVGREIADLTFDYGNRLAHKLYAQPWWPKNRKPRLPEDYQMRR